jgi:hypothetical protein
MRFANCVAFPNASDVDDTAAFDMLNFGRSVSLLSKDGENAPAIAPMPRCSAASGFSGNGACGGGAGGSENRPLKLSFAFVFSMGDDFCEDSFFDG